MSINLLTIFKNADLKNMGKATTDLISVALKSNSKTGTKIARAVMNDGTTLIKTITASGVVSENVIKIPEILTSTDRNNVIKDLAKNKFNQETIAAMLNISQSTVSNVLRKK